MPRINYSQTFSAAPIPLVEEDLSSQVDGSETIFSPSRAFVSGKFFVYLNGILQRNGTEVSSSDGTSFTLQTAPLSGDVLVVIFQPI
jgi:hypothetical protein